MASGSGKEVAGGKPGTASPTARDRLALQADVGQPKDPEAFRKAQSGSPLANDPASLQEWFHNDPKAALERVIEARDPALVPALVDLLQDQAITHFHIAEALEQISDEPDRTRAIEIKRSEEAQVESFPPRAVTSAAEDDEIREHVERGELREAFLINRARASELIVEDAKIDQTLRHSHANTLTRLLRHQARVQLFMALALARIAEEPQQKSRAIDILFAEAVQLSGDRETLCPTLRSLKSVEPRAVIPGLIAFLRQADDEPVLDAGFETLEHLFNAWFAAHAPEPPAAPSSERSTDFVEPPRVPIHPTLTILPGSEETSSVARKDATQEVSPTVAPPLDLDLSIHQFTTNGGGHDFSQGRSAAATTVHADPLDLATMSFTTTDQAVQHTRMLVSGPSERIAPAKAERERFRDGYRALGTLVESGQINAAVLKGPMAAINKAYRELDGAESQRVIGVSKAAKILSLTKSRVQQLAREGLGQKVAGRFLFTREELEREKQRPRSKGGRPPTADQLDLAPMFFTTADPAVQQTRTLLVSGPSERIAPARAEQERFKDHYRALGTLVESGEINTAALDGLMAALNEAYRELDGEGGASGQGKFPPPQELERDPSWVDRSFVREAFPTTGTGSQRVLGVSEAAGILGLTRSRVQQLARDGLIGQRVAGRFLFTREELEREKQRPRSKGGRPPTRRNEDSGRPETRPS